MFGYSFVRTSKLRWYERFVERCIEDGKPLEKKISFQNMIIEEMSRRLRYARKKHPDLDKDWDSQTEEKLKRGLWF